mgnify:CR=1 FL=1
MENSQKTYYGKQVHKVYTAFKQCLYPTTGIQKWFQRSKVFIIIFEVSCFFHGDSNTISLFIYLVFCVPVGFYITILWKESSCLSSIRLYSNVCVKCVPHAALSKRSFYIMDLQNLDILSRTSSGTKKSFYNYLCVFLKFIN